MAQLLPDETWERIRHLLPEERGPRPGRPPLPARRVLTGILFVLKSGLPWEDLPAELGCGSGMSCWRRLAAWRDDGTWTKVEPVLRLTLPDSDRMDWSRAAVDGAAV